MKDDKILALARKLKAMAEGGDENEAEVAMRKLKAYLAKHNLTTEDLDSLKVSKHVFKYHRGMNWLMGQVMATVCNTNRFYEGVKGNHVLGVKCTEAQAMEVECMYDFYHRRYLKALEIFHIAFIDKNNIYPKPSEELPERFVEDLTDEQREKHRMAIAMAEGIETNPFLKQLT